MADICASAPEDLAVGLYQLEAAARGNPYAAALLAHIAELEQLASRRMPARCEVCYGEGAEYAISVPVHLLREMA